MLVRGASKSEVKNYQLKPNKDSSYSIDDLRWIINQLKAELNKIKHLSARQDLIKSLKVASILKQHAEVAKNNSTDSAKHRKVLDIISIYKECDKVVKEKLVSSAKQQAMHNHIEIKQIKPHSDVSQNQRTRFFDCHSENDRKIEVPSNVGQSSSVEQVSSLKQNFDPVGVNNENSKQDTPQSKQEINIHSSAIKIRDLVVTDNGDPPLGEAPKLNVTQLKMDSLDREHMMSRLNDSIINLLNTAKDEHALKNRMPDSNKRGPDYITRLITNEFFFYTKEPLTLSEFSHLQNRIAEKAKSLPSGIQLILGSFAVKTDDNTVMNVTPHITCGVPPSFNFIVKNYTSNIDVRYKEIQQARRLITLGMCDITTTKTLPKIKVNGSDVSFSYHNIVASKSPRGVEFLTVVDVCLDHYMGVGISNHKKMIESDHNVVNLPIAHVVVSNTIKLIPLNCLGNVTHADPRIPMTQYRHGLGSETQNLRIPVGPNRVFGNNTATLLCLPEKSYKPPLEMSFRRTIKKLHTLKWGDKDELMNAYIKNKENAFLNETCIEKKIAIQNELVEVIKKLESNLANREIRSIIQNFREKAGLFTIGMNKKANNIEVAMSNVPIEQRVVPNTAVSLDVLRALAYHRVDWFKTPIKATGEIDDAQASNTFKRFKQTLSALRPEKPSLESDNAVEKIPVKNNMV